MPPMFGSAENAFQFPCIEPYKSLYCFNEGQCFERYNDDQQQFEEANIVYPAYNQDIYANGDIAGNSVLDNNGNIAAIEQQEYRPADPSSINRFCQCAPNYHGLRCEKSYDSDVYELQSADQTEPGYARTYPSSDSAYQQSRHHHRNLGVASAAIDQVQYDSFIMPLLLVLLLVSLLALLCCVIYCRRRRRRKLEQELTSTKLPEIIERF